MITEERKEELIRCCQELIRCQSYSGEESIAAACLTNMMKKLGFAEVITDKYGNIIGHIKGKKPGKKILFVISFSAATDLCPRSVHIFSLPGKETTLVINTAAGINACSGQRVKYPLSQ